MNNFNWVIFHVGELLTNDTNYTKVCACVMCRKLQWNCVMLNLKVSQWRLSTLMPTGMQRHVIWYVHRRFEEIHFLYRRAWRLKQLRSRHQPGWSPETSVNICRTLRRYSKKIITFSWCSMLKRQPVLFDVLSQRADRCLLLVLQHSAEIVIITPTWAFPWNWPLPLHFITLILNRM